MAKREYTSMRGKKIDLELLKKINELTPAIGNAKVNARGDELGPGGRIIRKREDIIKEYYRSSPNQVVQETNPRLTHSTVAAMPTEDTSKTVENVESNDWVEDDSGNFVKKEKYSKKSKSE
jgi:hypothetical protein